MVWTTSGTSAAVSAMALFAKTRRSGVCGRFKATCFASAVDPSAKLRA